MNEKTFNIPEFEYFEMGGKYSGCKRGTAHDDFNFRFTPKEKLTAQIWYGIKCFEKSELISESEFDITREGYHAACDWVEEQYSLWIRDHSLLPPGRGYFSAAPSGFSSFNEEI